jgi:hypothetical protein
MKLTFVCQDASTSKIFGIGRKINNLYTSNVLLVWCAVADFGVIGPYFFEEDGETVTVTSDRYVQILRNFLGPKVNERGNPAVWFQQDCATVHRARESMEVLREMFPGCLISLRGDIPWPGRSPDLAACDFFLWGHLKAEVNKRRPRTTDEQKAAIQHEIAAIPPEMTRRMMRNFRMRLQMCIENESRHLDDIIFKKRLKKVNTLLSDCQITI